VLRTSDRLWVDIEGCGDICDVHFILKKHREHQLLAVCQDVYWHKRSHGNPLLGARNRSSSLVQWPEVKILSPQAIDGHAASDQCDPGGDSGTCRVVISQQSSIISEQLDVDGLHQVLYFIA
jgi:hypothetical protein